MRVGCPERVSWPLSCGMGHVIGAEKGTGQEFLPQRNRIPRQVASFKGLARARTSHHSAAVGRIFLGQVGA